MEKNQMEQLRAIPKVVLHLHLDGSLRPETVQKWLKEEGQEISLEEVKDKLMVDKDCKDLNQYLEKFDLPCKMLQTKERIKQATYELFEDLANQGVIYAEVRFAPSLHTAQGLSYEEIVQAAIEGLNEAKEKCNIDGNLILCCMRGNNNQESNLETVKVAKQFLEKGVCAVDLAGAEALFPTENFEKEFELARSLNIPFTIHAGEAAGSESVKKALELGAKRIGHGVRSIEDKELLEKLIREEILLEVCPISNIQTQAIIGKHPIEELYRKGVRVSISPDNDTVSSTDILEEYKWILENTRLTIDDIIKMNIYAARGAFVSPVKKAGLVANISKYESKEEIKGEEKC